MHLSTWYNTLEGWQGRAHDTVNGRLLDMCHNKEVLLHYGTQHTSRHLYCCRQFHSPHWLHPLAAAKWLYIQISQCYYTLNLVSLF